MSVTALLARRKASTTRSENCSQGGSQQASSSRRVPFALQPTPSPARDRARAAHIAWATASEPERGRVRNGAESLEWQRYRGGIGSETDDRRSCRRGSTSRDVGADGRRAAPKRLSRAVEGFRARAPRVTSPCGTTWHGGRLQSHPPQSRSICHQGVAAGVLLQRGGASPLPCSKATPQIR
jgi:hypothetical protein